MDSFTLTAKLLSKMFTWRAMVDIFLVAVVLFFLYRTLLRLGTWKIVAGIFVAMVIFFAASVLGLTGIEWIYSNVSHVAVIALIVIFQPELRKIFERAASMRRSEIGDTGQEVSKILVEAVFALTRMKRGAILVLPGKEPVQEWLSGGTNLDAEPSFPLIMSIFDPNSPGHDGALVIRNGRLASFGVRLPMSKSTRLSEEYGTRHHAAMGLAEATDALVLAVSEERGRVTIFRNGRARRAPDEAAVFSAIMEHWQQTSSYPFESQSAFRRWILGPQMIVSLGLAFLFWTFLMIAQGEVLEKIVSVPVEYTTTSPNLALVGERLTEVKLHLAGTKPDLDALNTSQLSVKVDLSKAMPGTQNFIVTEDSIRLPKDIKLMDAVPSSIFLTLAAIVEQEVVVNPQLVGRLPFGLRLRSVELKPAKLRVRSPVVDDDKNSLSLTTTPIYLETIREDTQLFCKIIAPPTVQPVGKPWPDVEVVLRVGPAKKE